PANRAVRAQAPGSVAGRFKVTEQGEVIFARYGNRAIARRHIEQVTSAVLEASAPLASRRDPAHSFGELAAAIDAPSRSAYRRLVEAPGFERWFGQVSPVEELGRLRIASRPQRRTRGRRLEDLRAIPWVFAWSQMRLNLAGWYGIGSCARCGPCATRGHRGATGRGPSACFSSASTGSRRDFKTPDKQSGRSGAVGRIHSGRPQRRGPSASRRQQWKEGVPRGRPASP